MKYKIIKPVRPSTLKDKKKMVTIKVGNKISTIHFGQKGYRHNYSERAWENYMKRSAGIRDGKGRLTKDNPTSANYWARKVLWNGGKWRK
jgi:hypothetical protein